MKKAVVICGHYLPGYRAGGPIQTVKNFVETFGDKVDFHLLTHNHDFGDKTPYEGITDGWNRVGKAKVMYLADGQFTRAKIAEIVSDADVVFCCSLFALTTIKTLLLFSMSSQKAKLFVAPMGEFSYNAFHNGFVKTLKKFLFIKMFGLLGCFDKVTWSFTSEEERKDAENILGQVKDFVIARNISGKPLTEISKHKKIVNQLNIVFLSRISPKKNLDKCLEVLDAKWNGKINFNIFGPLEDKDFWNKCVDKIGRLPVNVECKYCGEVKHDDVVKTLAKYDFFFFPTKGENYGHVIFEALSAGCVPLISDQTPWGLFGIEECGHIVTLDNLEGYRAVIKRYLRMDENEFDSCSHSCIRFVQRLYDESVRNSGYGKIFVDRES